MMNGWIKLHRKSLDSSTFQNPMLWQIWCWCLMKASSKPYDAIIGLQTVHLERGQFVFGYKVLADDVGSNVATVRRYMLKLQKMGNVKINSTNKYSIVTVVNWDSYQCLDDAEEGKVKNKRKTNDNIQEGKENNNKLYGEFQNVSLSDKELEKLKNKFPQDYKDRIENLSAYKKSKGKRYKSDYATILNWARMETKKEDKRGVEKIDW